MALKDYADILISFSAETVTRAGFGTLLFITEDTTFAAGTVKGVYGSLEEVVDDFAVGTEPYEFATAAFSQDNGFSKLKIGVKGVSQSWTAAYTALTNADADFYAVAIESRDYFEIVEVSTAVQAAGKMFMGVTADVDAGNPATIGGRMIFSADFVASNSIAMTINGTPISPVTYATSHAATFAALVTAIEGALTGESVTADAVARTIVITSPTAFTITGITVTGGATQAAATYYDKSVAAELTEMSMSRTGIIYKSDGATTYPEAAWFGRQLPEDPGTTNWAYKSLTGMQPDTLTTAKRNHLRASRCNYYESVAGNPITFAGYTCKAGIYFDIIRGLDWLQTRMQEDYIAKQVSTDRIPYIGGDAIIEQIVRTRLDSAVSVGMIASGYSVTVPASRDQEASDRAARHFADVTFNATYTGAINTIEVRGVVAA